MAHNLSTFTDASGVQRHCLLSLRENPWHKLGQVIEQPVGSSKAITIAGLDWDVEKRGLYTDGLQPVPEHRAAIRTDTKAVLGIVKESYQPVQNRQLFAWMDSLAGAAPIVYETAGALGLGETVWILARMPDEIRIGKDLTQTYLLLYSGHAANKNIVCAPTGVRVICQNTLRLAAARILNSRSKRPLEAGFRIRHTSGVQRALDDVAAAYGRTKASIDATRQAYEHLSRIPITESMISTVLEQSFKRDPLAPSEADRAAAMRKAREERIRAILASPTCTGESVSGTAFALLNSITEYVDFARPTRTRDGQTTGTQRFASAHWGSGAVIKEAAWEAIMEVTHP
jgi:phage/plasmid-like protein (TIGR03299 family)